MDFDGNARPAQAAAQARHDQIAGLHAFDPKKMTWIINSSLFHMYTKSMMLIEEIPDMLARAAEACPCHRDLSPHLTDYRRRQLFEKRYGQSTYACPMAGKLVPELVGGMLHDACVRPRCSWHRGRVQLP